MKRFCTRHGIATAAYEVFDDPAAAEAYVRAAGRPLVVKADGLAAGKGVVVASNVEEALGAVDRFMRKRELGDAGAVVVIEEVLPGEEASFHVVCDGERFVPLAAAQDHKRIFDGDRGPNTGGMGAYAPAPIVTDEVREKVLRAVVEPTLAGMAQEGAPFRGVLFVGLMIEAGEPRVLEYNVRFGDPETSVIVPLLVERIPLGLLLDGAARGDLRPALGLLAATREASESALCVVMAAEGYPGKPRTGDRDPRARHDARGRGVRLPRRHRAPRGRIRGHGRGARAHRGGTRADPRGGGGDRLPRRRLRFTGAASSTGATSATARSNPRFLIEEHEARFRLC